MQKPYNYDNTKAFSGYEPLPAGGYVCTIHQVVETFSKTGKEMLQIWLDIARGEHKDFFMREFTSDTRQDKKWPCICYQMVLNNDGSCNRGLKTFIEAVENSNDRFDLIWGDQFVHCFSGKQVGVVFRREQYENQKGELKWSVKPYRFCAADEAEGQAVPEDKPLEKPSYMSDNTAYTDIYGQRYQRDYGPGNRLPWDE